MQKISTWLWFDNQGEEAARFYTSIFANSKLLGTQGPVTSFVLEGIEFYALNGGKADFGFTPAVSLYVDCRDQSEVDALWDKLTADGGSPGQCGWLTDKYGVSWQIIPRDLPELLADPDHVKAERVMTAMLGMQKIDVDALKQAAIVEGA